MNDATVLLTALGIVGACVSVLAWLAKYLLTQFKVSLDKNTASHEKVAQATSINTKVSEETLTFMKNLNGRLAKITAEKINE